MNDPRAVVRRDNFERDRRSKVVGIALCKRKPSVPFQVLGHGLSRDRPGLRRLKLNNISLVSAREPYVYGNSLCTTVANVGRKNEELVSGSKELRHVEG